MVTWNAVLLLQKYYFGLFSIPHKKKNNKKPCHLQILNAVCRKERTPTEVTKKSWGFMRMASSKYLRLSCSSGHLSLFQICGSPNLCDKYAKICRNKYTDNSKAGHFDIVPSKSVLEKSASNLETF